MASVKMNFGVEYPGILGSAYYERYTGPRPDSSALSLSAFSPSFLSTLMLK